MHYLHDSIQFIFHLNDNLIIFVQHYGLWIYALLFAIIFCETGLVVTAIMPGDSLLFAAGARRIPMATLGILQYISPSLQMLVGVWLYGEAFESARFGGFGLVWAALVVYSLEGLWIGCRPLSNQN